MLRRLLFTPAGDLFARGFWGRSVLVAVGVLLLLAGGLAGAGRFIGLPALADVLDVREADFAGQPLVVGVAWLPPPQTPDRRLYMEEGFERELAAELADALSAELRLVRIAPEDAAAALDQGRADLVLARVEPDDPLRTRAVVRDTGFASGLGVAMRTDRPLAAWDDLKGRVVCASQANGEARRLAERLGARVELSQAPAEALMRMRTGDCDAAIHDRALLDPLLGKRSWQKFSAVLPQREPTTLVAATAPGRRDVARAVKRALATIGTPERWQQREERWASTVSFEVYRDQVAADCH